MFWVGASQRTTAPTGTNFALTNTVLSDSYPEPKALLDCLIAGSAQK